MDMMLLTFLVFFNVYLALGASTQVITALETCGRDKFWQKSTETCEPCSILCDPPNVYITECPKRCPNYRPTPTPPKSTGHGEWGKTWLIVFIFILIASVGLFLCFVCLLKKYWENIKAYFHNVVVRYETRFPTQEECSNPEDHQLTSISSGTPLNVTIDDDDAG